VPAGGAFPVSRDEAGERPGCYSGFEPVLRPAAGDEFGQVSGDESITGTHSVDSVNGDRGLAEYRAINQRQCAVCTELDDSLARPQGDYSPGQLLRLAGADCYCGFIIAANTMSASGMISR